MKTKKTFKLVGLGCANCASKMEKKIKGIKGVDDVIVNFMTSKLIIEANEDNIDAIIEEATKIINKIEPDVEIKNI